MFRNIRIITEGIAAGDPWRPVFCRNHDVIYDNFSFKERPVAHAFKSHQNNCKSRREEGGSDVSFLTAQRRKRNGRSNERNKGTEKL